MLAVINNEAHWLQEPASSVKARQVAPEQRAAFAFIAIGMGEERRYLLQWNAKWDMFNLIGGKVENGKGDDDSFARAIRRELEEEMGLKGPDECYVVRELQHVQVRQFSYRERVVKDYRFRVFEVEIFPSLLPMNGARPNYAARWLSTGRENIFVSSQEIENLRTQAGRPISPTTRYILQALGELTS